MRLLPRSLFGRVVLVVASVLVIAQLASFALHMHERGELLMQASGMRAAQRIADIVKLFDSVAADDRERIAKVLSAPPLTVRVGPGAQVLETEPAAQGPRAALFASLVRRFLADDRAVRVRVSETAALSDQIGPMHGPMGMGGGHMQGWSHFMPGMGYWHQVGISLLAQITLADGSLVTVESRQPGQTANWPYRLLWSIAIVVAAAVVVAWIAVRWTTKPLHTLALAADELGRNVNRAPIPEQGPTEVARAARAFNNMQSQLREYLSSRTRLLAAMSHDLKTPITRLRLRSELLDDPTLRVRYSEDLQELESMVTATLDFLRGIQNDEPANTFDVMAMLEALAADRRETGANVAIEGQSARPYCGQRQAIRRCLSNLLDNAIKYGGSATVAITDEPAQLTLCVVDSGPGIAPDELEKVFEPFYRIEASRARETGGSGLGLAIARQIARAHGGEVTLFNRVAGGLEARLVLPRERTRTAG
jgi:signal transduction histidine kinase